MEKLVVLRNKKFTKVVGLREYRKMFEDRDCPYEVVFLEPGEEIFYKRLGKFESFWACFTEERGMVKISWKGEKSSLNYSIGSLYDYSTVKSAIESTGLSAEDFLRVFYKLYKAGDLDHIKESK